MTLAKYIAIVNSNMTDRVKILYAGTSKDIAIHKLWHAYNQHLQNNLNRIDAHSPTYTKESFATSVDDERCSAYLLLSNSYINYELHCL